MQTTSPKVRKNTISERLNESQTGFDIDVEGDQPQETLSW